MVDIENLFRIHSVIDDNDFPCFSKLVLTRCRARSRSPILNQYSCPSVFICSKNLNESPAMPHPLSLSRMSARPYVMVSISGHTYNPYNHKLSAIFEMMAKSSEILESPRAIFTEPVPPANSVINTKEHSCCLYNFFKFS